MHIQLFPWHSTKSMFANISFVLHVQINKMEKAMLLVAVNANTIFYFFFPLSRRSRKSKPPFLVTCGEWETSREKTSRRRLCRSAPCGCQAQGSRWALLPSRPSGRLPRGHKMRQTRITLPGILNNWHFWKGLHLRWFCFCFVFSGSHIKKDGKPCFREHGLFWLCSFWSYLLNYSFAVPITNPL